jgi:hypothetical protein
MAQDDYPLNIPSPQTYSWIQYRNTPVSLYNGEIDLNIPVYTYKDNDFELPIFLKYNSAGYIPNQRDGITGLDWNLITGGVIYREIKGSPDEYYFDELHILNGTYYAIEEKKGIETLTRNYIFSLPEEHVLDDFFWQINKCEIEPDEFSFTMPGHSGKFYIQNNGEVKCQGGNYKVSLNFGLIHSTYSYLFLDSEIIITTDNGYKYYFGGGVNRWELSFPLFPDEYDLWINTGKPVIKAWYLYKIVAPNGREVLYEFREKTGYDPRDTWGNEEFFLLHSYYVQNTYSYANFLDCIGLCSKDIYSGSTLDEFREVTKTVYLENIKIDSTEINFSYSEKDMNFYTDEDYNSMYNLTDLKLDSIVITNTDTYKKFEFEFERRGNGTTKKPLFLVSFKKEGENPYRFSYYDNYTFPDPKTKAIDHWGFWNNQNSQKLIPDVIIYSNSDYEINSNDRSPNSYYSKAGMLKEITYPTGGSSSYFYESHDYNKRLERRNSSDFFPALFEETGIAGGVRISKIIDNDGISDFKEREFKYIKNYPGTNGSGILMKWPRYVSFHYYTSAGYLTYWYRASSNSFYVNHHPGEKYIHYSEITELVNDERYITRKYNSYEDVPDSNDINTRVILFTPATSEQYMLSWGKGLLYNDKSFARGSLNEIIYYSNLPTGNVPVLKKKYEYCQLSDFPNHYLVGVTHSGYYAEAYKVYYYPFSIKKITETVYDVQGQNPMLKISKYNYEGNNHDYCTKSIVYSSNRDSVISYYYYPQDYPLGVSTSSAVLDTMIARNITEPILLEETKLNGTVLVSGTINNYKLDNNIVVPSNIEISRTDGLYEPQIIFDKYNTGNLSQFHKADDINTAYLWDNTGTYVMAKVENATYS